MPILWQADSLEGGHKVVSETDNLQVQSIGSKGASRDVSEGKILTQFPNADLDDGTSIVETLNPGRA